MTRVAQRIWGNIFGMSAIWNNGADRHDWSDVAITQRGNDEADARAKIADLPSRKQTLMDGLRATLFGLGLGLVMSFAATRIFQSMLFGTKPLDPVVLCGVIATLSAVAVLACLARAWRASRLDPIKAHRTE